MPATTLPAWPTPTDGVDSVTTRDQLETEQSIHALFAPLRPPHLNHISPPLSEHPSPLINPWLTDDEQQQLRATHRKTRTIQSIPQLNRQSHIKFLTRMLDPLPGSYVSFDTNRSWLLYWVLHSFDILAATLDAKNQAKAIATLLSFQNKSGGFGGSANHVSHLMSSYAAINALAIIGGPGPAPTNDDIEQGQSVKVGRGGWDDIDRQRMYDWMLSLKQPDGSFLVHDGGEVDVRASYCVICIASLLGICTRQLIRGMGDFIASCQTYEGGLAASSQPSYSYLSATICNQTLPAQIPVLSDSTSYRPQLGEAHGGYTFCAVATHFALSGLPFCGDGPILPSYPSFSSADLPSETIGDDGQPHCSSAGPLDLARLVRWSAMQQGLPIEGGGFRGRTNKLVDGCYGWFSGGGLHSILTALQPSSTDMNGILSFPDLPSSCFGPCLSSSASSHDDSTSSWVTEEEEEEEDKELDLDPDLSSLTLYDRMALQQYILLAAQRPPHLGGGLCDKPSQSPDAYHTCYNLSGLAASQHVLVKSDLSAKYLSQSFKQTNQSDDAFWQKHVYINSLAWTMKKDDLLVIGDNETIRCNNQVQPVHPIFNITFPKVKAIMDWAYGQAL